jgi:uncharacterized protein (TIGR02145 family)
MKSNKTKTILLVITNLLFGLVVFAQNPTVTNVTFSQRTDGSHIVDIYYVVNNSGGGTMTVTMEVSDDNGTTWNFPCVQISGDVGSGITSGTNKHIVWNFGVEHPNTFDDQFRIKITADGGGGMGVPCPGIPTVTYADKTYNTVQIGTQCWLKENLDVGTMVSGGSNQINNGIKEKYCYQNFHSYCNIYGGLYQWNEAMQYTTTPGVQGICPPGWHLPTLAEFQALAVAVNNDGNALKREDQGSGGRQGTNTSGFSALLAGYRGYYGYFLPLGWEAHFWSSSNAYNLELISDDSNIDLYLADKDYGFSIRCLRDTLIESLNINSPNGGENWQVGSTQNITWASSNVTNVKLEYTTNNGTSWLNIIDSTPASSGSYSWTIPNTPSIQCKVKLTDTNNSAIGDISNNLFIISSIDTVQIGDQCWLKENLDVGVMILGSQNQNNNGVIEKYCYDDDPNNCYIYGGLYQWDETMQYTTTPGTQGICPTGWHIPTFAEFQTLATTVNNDGNALLEVGQGGGTNSSGFSALLAGARGYDGGYFFSTLGINAFFWISEEWYGNYPFCLQLWYNGSNIELGPTYKESGFSVRCVKD